MAASLLHHPAKPPRIPAVTRILAQFERPQLEGFISVAISLLDAIDGDPDEEVNGDELDGNPAEDEFMYHGGYGPGCPVGDPGEDEHDAERDADGI